MQLSRIILGPVVTEKSERLKTDRCYSLKVHPDATKIDVQNALKKFFDVDVASVRVMRTVPKSRSLNNGASMTKRHRAKKVMVTLTAKSDALDLAKFKL